MKILITGGTGFIGSNLTQYFLEKKNEVVATGSSPENRSISHPGYTYISADTSQKGDWQDVVDGQDVIINLAGRSIFKPWTRRYKGLIYKSRIETTRNIVNALKEDSQAVLCSASAIGYYGDKGDEKQTENRGPGNDFLARVCVDWEKEAAKAEEKGTRVAVFRLGVVLGNNGGAIPKMLPAFKFFMGGPLGSGKHWFPWIHIDDVSLALELIIGDSAVKGPLNFCSPGSIQHRDFARALGKVLHRPSFLKVPAFSLRLLMGELGRALISSQRAVPARLLDRNYQFKYPEIEKALESVV